MRNRLKSYSRVVIGICLILTFCMIEGEAQTKKKRKTRRRAAPTVAKPVITNPPIAAPAETEKSATGDVKIISTADANKEATPATESSETVPGSKPQVINPETGDQEQLQQTIHTLSNQVNKLNDRLQRMQDDDRYQLDMERLTRAEQRAEQLRSQLMDVQGKIADFEAKLEQIELALRPENIESATAGYGSTHPEAARDARKKQLEGERSRVQAQMKLAENSRSRLEVAVANADSEVDLLRAKLNQRREQMDATPNETPSAPAPKPRKP
jgi:predicted  nucleic acid-binding Zn-ribbon protein